MRHRFREEVKAQGYKPGVYASTLWYRKRVNLNSLKKYTIWNAHYGVASSPIDCAPWQGKHLHGTPARRQGRYGREHQPLHRISEETAMDRIRLIALGMATRPSSGRAQPVAAKACRDHPCTGRAGHLVLSAASGRPLRTH
ncbi:MAG: hypothetical protein ACLVJH_17945 [Faecalibacterium prausnitzii]